MRKKPGARRKKRAARPPKKAPAFFEPSTWRTTGAAICAATATALRGCGFALAWAFKGLRVVGVRIASSRDIQRLAAVTALAAALVVASHGVRKEVISWERFNVDTSGLSSIDVPEGLSERVSRDLARLPLPRPASGFDRRLVPFTAAVLSDLDWVEEVESVRLETPARLTFALRTRRPLAQLGSGRDAPVLTSDAAVMDRGYALSPDLLPRVLGIPGLDRMLARRRSLIAAVSVMEQLEGLLAKVESIDLRRLGKGGDEGESDVVLTLRCGPRVDWGRVGADERPHLPGESKRAALEEFLEGGIDLCTVDRISLRWDETTYTLKSAMLLAVADRR